MEWNENDGEQAMEGEEEEEEVEREDRFKEDYYFLLRLLGLLLLYSLQADVFGWLLDVVLGQLRKRWREAEILL